MGSPFPKVSTFPLILCCPQQPCSLLDMACSSEKAYFLSEIQELSYSIITGTYEVFFFSPYVGIYDFSLHSLGTEYPKSDLKAPQYLNCECTVLVLGLMVTFCELEIGIP